MIGLSNWVLPIPVAIRAGNFVPWRLVNPRRGPTDSECGPVYLCHRTMRILIVDDDAVSLEMLGHALTRAGHEVINAGNGREALGIVGGGACRVVISDWEMPEMTGVELCRAIRAEDAAGYVYVILLSARGHKDVVEGLSAGADDFMSKPFNPAEMSVRVRIGERVLSLETRDLTIFAMAKRAESR